MSNRERIAELAKDTLILSRNTLLVNLRFLDCALSMLDFLLSEDGCIPGTPIPMNGGLIVTGKQIIYEPMWVLSRYRNEKEAIVQDYLHMVFHCIFHHPFVGGLMDTQRWDLACDIAVESVIDDLGISCVAAQRSRKQAAARADQAAGQAAFGGKDLLLADGGRLFRRTNRADAGALQGG